VATVILSVFELLSLIPVSTVVAINLQLGAVISQMLVNSFDSLNNLTAAKAFNLHALSFVLNVLFKIFQEYTLMNLVVVTSMENFYLSYLLYHFFIKLKAFNIFSGEHLVILDNFVWNFKQLV
jgi:hypothetical protein